MILINRLAERCEITSLTVIAQDSPTDNLHVLVCPLSGDIEIWDGERLEFKAYCDAIDCRSTSIGLSGFFHQKDRGKKWTALVKQCKMLPHDLAFQKLYRFAVDLAAKLEDNFTGETCAPRSIDLPKLEAVTMDERRARRAAGFPPPPFMKMRAKGDAITPGMLPSWVINNFTRCRFH